MPGQPVVVDACTGSGCVACALALMAPQARVLATDISSDALALASENARRLGANVEFIQTDLLEGLPPASVDMVVSNPPYVSTADCANLPAHVRDFEPAMASMAAGRPATHRGLFPRPPLLLCPRMAPAGNRR